MSWLYDELAVHECVYCKLIIQRIVACYAWDCCTRDVYTELMYDKIVVHRLVYGEVTLHELMYRSEIVNNELMIAYCIKSPFLLQ